MRLLAIPSDISAPEPKRAVVQPPRCKYIIEKTCSDECDEPRCVPYARRGRMKGPKPQIGPRVWGRYPATVHQQWVADARENARVFERVEEARAFIRERALIHAVIVDRCHPWNRGGA